MMRRAIWSLGTLLAWGMGCAPSHEPFAPVVVESSLGIRAVPGFADERGEAILVGTDGAPLRIRADGQRGTLHPHPANVSPVGEVRALFPMGPHRTLVAASGGVFVAASGWVMEPLWSQPLDPEGMRGAAESQDGTAWLAHRLGLFRVKDGALSELKLEGESVQGLTAITAGRAEDGADGVWFAHQGGLSVLVATAPGQLVVRPSSLWSGDQEEIHTLVSLGDSQQQPGELWALGKAGLLRLSAQGWKKQDLGGPVDAVAGGGRSLWAEVGTQLLHFDANSGGWSVADGIPGGFNLLAADAAGAAWIRFGDLPRIVQRARIPRLLGLDQNQRMSLTEISVAALFPPGAVPTQVRYELEGEEQLTLPPTFSMGGTTDEGALLPYSLLGMSEGLHTLRATAVYEDGSQATREVPFDFRPVDNTPLSWAADVQPIHVDRCAKCHDTGPGHNLSTYEAWKQEAALISQALRDRRMPADGPLDPTESILIQRWAQSGALP